MLSAGIRAVFFDAVGTLIVPDPPVAQAYAEAGRRHGCELPGDLVLQRFRQAFRDEARKDAILGGATSEERERQRWRAIVGNVFEHCSSVELIFTDLYDHFARPSAWRLTEGTGETLAELSRPGLTLGLASNFDHRQNAIANDLPELSQIKHRVISSEIGWLKPSPRFFEAVIVAASCPAAEIVFVGDDRINDYTGANAAGLQAVLFDPRPDEIPGVVRIRRLTDLLR